MRPELKNSVALTIVNVLPWVSMMMGRKSL
jgi:hypothetical protein